MAITTITGLGSGLDINKLVPALVEAEKAPKQSQIDNQKVRTETQLSAVGMLKSALETFESSLLALKSSSTSFDGYKAVSSKTSVASVTMGASAVAGSYKLEVESLATASKVVSAVQAKDAAYDAGELKIKLGDGAEYAIAISDGATLEDIRESINSQLSSKGISANILTDNSGSRLVLSSELTGDGNDISVTGTAGTSLVGLDIDGKQKQSESVDGAGFITPAANAKYSIDGLEMSNKDNTITGLQGLTIKLQEEGTTTLTVSANTQGIQASVESFVMAYNTLLTVTNGLSKVTATTDKDGNATTQAGALVADSTLRSMMSQMRTALTSPVDGAGSLQVLAQLGVSTNRDGTLALDNDKLKAAVADDPAGIKQFFTGDKGLFNRIGDITTVYSGASGLLASRETSLNSTITGLAEEQASLDRRIENLTLTMYKKFNAMDGLVARLNATRESVMATLNALNKKSDD
ncbi:flagellar filament capping protein FliD [Pseudomonas sp.]|uniref:flagellar filament capping protein FliD n=1 Tax=Pseudomonas sp. TaxID=306 RepID=UPI0019D8CB79|nr:flagellar filament capping protein FliD [Pseudomonas sp.]MBF0676241.1 flagellar filament capping protein FliD [Pseudomonas sp.]